MSNAERPEQNQIPTTIHGWRSQWMGHPRPCGCCADCLRDMSSSGYSPRIRGISLSPRNRPHSCPCHQSFTRDKDASRQQVGKSLSRVPVCRPLRGTRTAPRIRDRVSHPKHTQGTLRALNRPMCSKRLGLGGLPNLYPLIFRDAKNGQQGGVVSARTLVARTVCLIDQALR